MPPALSITYSLPAPIARRGRPRRCAGPRDSRQCHRRCAEQVPRQARKHGKITQKFASTLSTSHPPGQQRAAATDRRTYPAEEHGRPERKPPAAGIFLASPAGGRWKRSMAMCAEDDVSPGARYCDKALPRRWFARRRAPCEPSLPDSERPCDHPAPGPGLSVADRQRQPTAVNAHPEWRTEQPVLLAPTSHR